MTRRFIKTPILDRLVRALRSELDALTPEEMQQLEKECKKATNLNCEAQRYAIANLYGHHVSCIVRNRRREPIPAERG